MYRKLVLGSKLLSRSTFIAGDLSELQNHPSWRINGYPGFDFWMFLSFHRNLSQRCQKEREGYQNLNRSETFEFSVTSKQKWCLRVLTWLFFFHQVLFISVQNAGSTSTGFIITPETAPSLHVSTVKRSHLFRPHKQVTSLPTCTTTLYKLSLYSWQSHVS